MKFFGIRLAGYGNQAGNLIGILLALAIGVSGQLILSDPVKFLAPELPMLSPQDWPGSQLMRERIILYGRSWRSERSFSQSLGLMRNGIFAAEAAQVITWHADPLQAAAAWRQQQNEPYYDYPTVASSTDKDKPQSLLFCNTPAPDTYRECAYRAYWGHWYTQVNFYLGLSDDFPLSEVQKLTDRVDALLFSAPDKPCAGLFCPPIGEADVERP